MRGLTTGQNEFASAIFKPFAPVPYPVRAATARRSKSGLDVYRNNVVAGLINALAARFPVVNRLLGNESFRIIAHQYVIAEPPRSPIMLHYGATFPRFLRELRRGVSTEYLADIGELELARGKAYHAADAQPVSAAAFSALSPGRLDRLRVRFHPSVQLVTSRFPVVTIWEANQADGGMIERWGAEAALVARPFLDVQLRRLLPGGFAFLGRLAGGGTMAEAVDAGLADFPDLNIVGNLAMLVESNIAVELRECG